MSDVTVTEGNSLVFTFTRNDGGGAPIVINYTFNTGTTEVIDRGTALSGDRIITRIGKSDVACVIRVDESDGFDTDGSHLVTILRISGSHAKTGGPAEIDTPIGRLRLSVPKNTQDGDRLMVAGRGLPSRDKRPAGDLYLDIEIVETMTDRAVAALDKILTKARRPRDDVGRDQVA